ncbi:MAG: alpha/beta hydrolase [Alphaproteobacteria bacterium]|nr:alpha/beta hydrolase [Alphaproteobacteria bacterium]
MTYLEAHFTTRDGLKLYYRDYANAAGLVPVLCLAGSTSNSRSFDDLAPHIAQTRRVLTMDWRGHGNSDWDPDESNYSFKADADDVVEFLAHLGVPKVVIIGTSRGGIIGMVLGLSNPEVLAGVVMNDIGPAIGAAGSARLRSRTVLDAEFATFDEAGVNCRARYDTPTPGLSDAYWTSYARRTCRRHDDGKVRPDYDPGYGRAFRAGQTTGSLWPAFESLANIPVLAIRGSESDILEAAGMAAMAQRKPDMLTATVPSRNHCPFLDEPESLAAIDGFLAAI